MCDGLGCVHDHHHAAGEQGCCLGGGRLRGYLQPCLLLLLLQQPSHGYELMERLANQPDMPEADPGLLYRTLRQMERDGLLTSAWDTAGQGAARRRYEVTAEGIEFLHAWAVEIAQMRQHLERFLDMYTAIFQQGKEP